MIKKEYRDKIVIGKKVYIASYEKMQSAIYNGYHFTKKDILEAEITDIKSRYFTVSFVENNKERQLFFMNNNLQEKTACMFLTTNHLFFSEEDVFNFIKKYKNIDELKKDFIRYSPLLSSEDAKKISDILSKYKK